MVDSNDNAEKPQENRNSSFFASKWSSRVISALGVLFIGTSDTIATENEKPAAKSKDNGAESFTSKIQPGKANILVSFNNKFFANEPFDYEALTKEECESLNKFITKTIEVMTLSKSDPVIIAKYGEAQQKTLTQYKNLTGEELGPAVKIHTPPKLPEGADVITRFNHSKTSRTNFDFNSLSEQDCRLLNFHLNKQIGQLSQEKGNMQAILDIQTDRNQIRNRYYELTGKVDIAAPDKNSTSGKTR